MIFKQRNESNSIWDIIIWWEIRRVIYNLILFICMAINYWFIEKSYDLKPHEDPIEPFMIWAILIAANFFYCFGWIAESQRMEDRSFGPRMLKLGIIFSIILLIFPSIIFKIL